MHNKEPAGASPVTPESRSEKDRTKAKKPRSGVYGTASYPQKEERERSGNESPDRQG